MGAFPSLSAHSSHPKTHCPLRAGAPFPAPALPLLTLQPRFWFCPASHAGGGCNGDTCGLESQILAHWLHQDAEKSLALTFKG